MKYLARPVRTGIASGIAVLAASGATLSVSAHGQVKPNVTVVNPATNPVNTRITNAVVPVEISNAEAIPVTAQESEGSRQIYHKSVTVDLAGSAGNCNHLDPVTVPAGKRLVIEYLSATSVFTVPAALVSISLRVPNGQLIAVAPAGKTAVGEQPVGDPLNYAAAGQYVHVYTDATLWACALVSNSTTEDLAINVAGYLVDKP
jgi:hypothetical protein